MQALGAVGPFAVSWPVPHHRKGENSVTSATLVCDTGENRGIGTIVNVSNFNDIYFIQAVAFQVTGINPLSAAAGIFRKKQINHMTADALSSSRNIFGRIGSIPLLLMPWLLASPGHQQQRHWLCRIQGVLSATTKVLEAAPELRIVRICIYVFLYFLNVRKGLTALPLHVTPGQIWKVSQYHCNRWTGFYFSQFIFWQNVERLCLSQITRDPISTFSSISLMRIDTTKQICVYIFFENYPK